MKFQPNYLIRCLLLLLFLPLEVNAQDLENRRFDSLEVEPSGPAWDASGLKDLPAGTFSKITGASIQKIEVVQSIQSLSATDDTKDQLVPILAGRKTYARVYANITSTGGYGLLNGEVTITTANNYQVVLQADQSISLLDQWNDSLNLKREWITLSLNFLIPSNLVVKDTVLNLEVTKLTDRYNNKANVPCSNCDTETRSVTVKETKPLRLVVVGLKYNDNSKSYQPRQLDYDLIPTWLQRAYPIATLDYSYRTVTSQNAANFDCGQANAQVAAIRTLDVGNGTDARTHYYGLVYDGGFFMRGCAAVPATPNPAAIGSGPTGSGTFGWDKDGSYGDWYTAHELGHTLGRSHVGGTCGATGIDPNYPFPKGQLSGPDKLYVGLDVGNKNYKDIPFMALPGTKWHDVMSYCKYQWVSSYTYDALRKRIIAENALPSGSPAPMSITSLASGSSNAKHHSIIGLIDLEGGAGNITSVHTTSNKVHKLSEDESAYHLKFYDKKGRLVRDTPLNITPLEGNEEVQKGLFQVTTPLDLSVTKIELTKEGVTLDFRETNKILIKRKSLKKSILNIRRVEDQFIANWQTPNIKKASQLSYDVLVSPDAGYTWRTEAIGQLTNDYRIDQKGLESYRSLTVKIIVNDGIHSREIVSDTIAL